MKSKSRIPGHQSVTLTHNSFVDWTRIVFNTFKYTLQDQSAQFESQRKVFYEHTLWDFTLVQPELCLIKLKIKYIDIYIYLYLFI